jgi:hypothetical protein
MALGVCISPVRLSVNGVGLPHKSPTRGLSASSAAFRGVLV